MFSPLALASLLCVLVLAHGTAWNALPYPLQTGSSSFGSSLAIDAAGKFAAVGAASDGIIALYDISSGGGDFMYAVNSAGLPSPFADDFGSAVSMSGDGLTFVVGAPGHTARGGVFVFMQQGTRPSNFSSMLALDPCGSSTYIGCGMQVALSGSGLLLAVATSDAPGIVLLFSRGSASSTSWSAFSSALSFADILPASGLPAAQLADQFGYSMGLSDDGSNLIIGAPNASTNAAAAAGCIVIFDIDLSGQAAFGTECLCGSIANIMLGSAVAMSGNGKAILIGAPLAGTFQPVYFVNNAWSIAPGWTFGAASKMATSIALSGDGAVSIIGAPAQQGGTGLVYACNNTQVAGAYPHTAFNGAPDVNGSVSYGSRVALASTKSAMLVAARGTAPFPGSVFVYTQVYPPAVTAPTISPSSSVSPSLSTSRAATASKSPSASTSTSPTASAVVSRTISRSLSSSRSASVAPSASVANTPTVSPAPSVSLSVSTTASTHTTPSASVSPSLLPAELVPTEMLISIFINGGGAGVFFATPALGVLLRSSAARALAVSPADLSIALLQSVPGELVVFVPPNSALNGDPGRRERRLRAPPVEEDRIIAVSERWLQQQSQSGVVVTFSLNVGSAGVVSVYGSGAPSGNASSSSNSSTAIGSTIAPQLPTLFLQGVESGTFNVFLTSWSSQTGSSTNVTITFVTSRLPDGSTPQASAAPSLTLGALVGVVLGGCVIVIATIIGLRLRPCAVAGAHPKGQTPAIREFDVFLSHNWAHKPVVEAFAALLKERGVRVWVDHELNTGRMEYTIMAALANSRVVVAFLSRHYLASEICRKELRTALADPVTRVVPVRLEAPPYKDAAARSAAAARRDALKSDLASEDIADAVSTRAEIEAIEADLDFPSTYEADIESVLSRPGDSAQLNIERADSSKWKEYARLWTIGGYSSFSNSAEMLRKGELQIARDRIDWKDELLKVAFPVLEGDGEERFDNFVRKHALSGAWSRGNSLQETETLQASTAGAQAPQVAGAATPPSPTPPDKRPASENASSATTVRAVSTKKPTRNDTAVPPGLIFYKLPGQVVKNKWKARPSY